MDLAVQRRLTLAFIAQIPATLVLTPRTRTRQPAGGYVFVPGTPREPVTVTFIENTAQSGQPIPTRTLDGVERVVEMQVVCPWGTPAAVYDTFTHQGKEWEVIGIFYDNGYETRLMVSGRG